MSLYLGDKKISGIGQDRIADTLPIGAIIEWDSDIIPENWLLLDGQAVSRTVYSELFELYGTKYGAGDGSTTFNLPDRRTRVAVGRDINDSDFNILGNKGGEKTHKLSVNEMPTHGSHINTGDAVLGTGNFQGYLKNTVMTTYSNTRGWDLYRGDEITPTGHDEGGSQSHNNLQPYIVTNFIIKAKLYTTEFIGDNIVIDNWDSDSSTNVLSAKVGKALHEEIRPIKTGGTGANNAEEALFNLGGMSMELVWENASPISEFAGDQKIQLTLEDYDMVKVDFNFAPSVAYRISEILPVKDTKTYGLICGIWGATGGIYGGYRRFDADKTGVHFSEGWKPIATSESRDDSYCIPIAIYGIKGVK